MRSYLKKLAKGTLLLSLISSGYMYASDKKKMPEYRGEDVKEASVVFMMDKDKNGEIDALAVYPMCPPGVVFTDNPYLIIDSKRYYYDHDMDGLMDEEHRLDKALLKIKIPDCKKLLGDLEKKLKEDIEREELDSRDRGDEQAYQDRMKRDEQKTRKMLDKMNSYLDKAKIKIHL